MINQWLLKQHISFVYHWDGLAAASFIVVPKMTVTYILYIPSVTSLYYISKLNSDYILKTTSGPGKSPVLQTNISPDPLLTKTWLPPFAAVITTSATRGHSKLLSPSAHMVIFLMKMGWMKTGGLLMITRHPLSAKQHKQLRSECKRWRQERTCPTPQVGKRGRRSWSFMSSLTYNRYSILIFIITDSRQSCDLTSIYYCWFSLFTSLMITMILLRTGGDVNWFAW